jgi:hypothetical protein
VPLRILLDEHISPTVAHELTELFYDVVALRDRSLLHLDDWDRMAWCIQYQRAICAKNRDHFEREHRRYQKRDEDHWGGALSLSRSDLGVRGACSRFRSGSLLPSPPRWRPGEQSVLVGERSGAV